MVRSHARRSGISSVDDLESESVSTEKENTRFLVDGQLLSGSGTEADPWLFSETIDEPGKYIFGRGYYRTKGVDVSGINFNEATNPVYLTGDGVRSTTIEWDNNASTDAPVIDISSTNSGNFGGVSDMTVWGGGDGDGTTEPLIRVSNIIDSLIQNAIIRYTDGDGIVLNSGSGHRLHNLWIEQGTGTGLVVGNGTRLKLSNIHMIDWNVRGIDFAGSNSQLNGLTGGDTGGANTNHFIRVSGDENSISGVWGDQWGGDIIRDEGVGNNYSNITTRRSTQGSGVYLNGTNGSVAGLYTENNTVDGFVVSGPGHLMSNIRSVDNGRGGRVRSPYNVINGLRIKDSGVSTSLLISGDANKIYGLNMYDADGTLDISGIGNVISVSGVLWSDINDTGTRNIINGYGTNAGDPNATGEWNNRADEAGILGVTIYDTTTTPWTAYDPTPNGDWSAQ